MTVKKINFLLVILITTFSLSAKDYIITDYGAFKDSLQLNTKIIQSAIDKAAANGGGVIVIPKGVFLSGALFFKPGTSLKLMEGAVLKGSDDISNYPLIPSRMEGQKLDYYAALVNAFEVDSFKISGPGTINGNGTRFWKEFWQHRDSLKAIKKESTNLEVHRPRLVFIWSCNNVVVENVKLRNSGFWTLHLYKCNNVKVLNTDIRSPWRPVPAPSTDGIDIDFCSNILIKGCYISVNDDAVCIKGGKGPMARNQPENGPTENIIVEDCTFGESHGTLTLGSESIYARNIILRNCVVNNPNYPLLRLKMRGDTYQTYENIIVENITGVSEVLLAMRPWTQFFDLKGTEERPYGTVRNITLKNIKMKCKSITEITGNPNDIVNNIIFQDIDVTADSETFNTSHLNAILFDNVSINGKIQTLKK